MYDLTGFQRDMLFIIAGMSNDPDSDEKGPNGLAVKRQIEEYYEEEIHHGRLYPNLDTLVEKGLVKKGEIDPRTNYYAVTRRGMGEIAQRRRWEDGLLEDVDLEQHGITPRMRG